MVKWIGAILGYMYFRFGGAFLGYFMGSFIDRIIKGNVRGSFGHSQNHKINTEDFELNLLSLSAIIIKADGKVLRNELNFVRNYFISNYGKVYADKIFAKFNIQIKKESQNIEKVTDFFKKITPYETRLQVVHFLFGIANADGHISELEVKKVYEIAIALGIRLPDFDSIKAMFVKQADNAYKILEIDPNVTDVEVKKAYREMAKKYHPDKLISDDPALKKGAQEKFQEVQKAYEAIQKKRNI
jgi:DnaJ like chaperone protein|tara:strand:+ start:871 stop:1599 length:729 start_codon:yes stop_codon:yes gene_type:complete